VSAVAPSAPHVSVGWRQVAGPGVGCDQPFTASALPYGEIFAVIFFFRAIGARYGHAIRAHVPGHLGVLPDVGDIECQVSDAMAKRTAKILADSVAAVDGPVVRGKVDGIGSVGSDQVVQATCVPVLGPGVARLAYDGGGVGSLGRLAHGESRFGRSAFCSRGSFHGEPHLPGVAALQPVGPETSADYRTTPGLVSF
jgi:hypothetical protein